MPLNKLDSIIKNTEGRILYVSPSDLDSTDSISNQGNSLARPFKTIQRALIESARFSYVRGNSNDIVEKTTILLMPGEHLIDNRPGFKIKNVSNNAKIVSPSNIETFANTTLDLNLNTNFDIIQEDNVLYKFNSVNGGVIVPRGTSIVGLDLRKTKIRPKYVPNPTDNDVENTAIFRITGAGYFWQFSIFDGDESGLVYTDPQDFSVDNRSTPIFSHHKLTCFEYADGVNKVEGYDLTDLDMYYAKLSNAYNTGSGSPNRNIDNKYPINPDSFAKRRPEYEIVGAFLADPIQISSIEAGSGGVPTNRVTVTTLTNHELNEGTPIKIDGVTPEDYNISTKVSTIDPDNPKIFTYLLPKFRKNLGTPGNASGSTVTIETDTVSGASPYIFNISMRSVYGMNGMTADGKKADGFRSMVVAQFTGVSLQKDDRAFVKYDKTSRSYAGISLSKVTGTELSNGSSSTNPDTTYHLDDRAIYRKGWETSHIKITNDSILQIVSVFAIGFNKHFVCESGGDASITNSNSNFGQLSLISDGFKSEAFDKDNKAFITHILPPKANLEEEENIDWLGIDVDVTTTVGVSTHLYIRGFETEDNPPPTLTQGYRVGSKQNDQLFLVNGDNTFTANILMENGVDNSFREFDVTSVSNRKLTIGTGHGLKTGEKIYIISDNADYPENITPHIVYYAIAFSTSPNTDKIEIASTKTDAEKGNSIEIYGGSKLRVQTRVVDKFSGEIGHPVQFDPSSISVTRNGVTTTEIAGWFITVNSGNTIYPELSNISEVETNPTFIKRIPDGRSIDEKVFKLRVVIPKEFANAKNPEEGFIIQESSTTNARNQSDFTLNSIGLNDFEFERNLRLIAEATHSLITSKSTIRTELPHNLEVGDKVIIRGIKDSTNTDGTFNFGYNGLFSVDSVTLNNMEFTYTNSNSPGTFSIPTSRDEFLPRFERNDNKNNFYIYRSEVINDYIENQQDGVYHIYALKSDYAVPQEFTDLSFSQNVTDLYPQLDRDNINDTPISTKSKALSSPIGEVYTSDLKGSVTRECTDDLLNTLNKNLFIASSTNTSAGVSTITFKRNHNFNRVLTGTLTDPSSTRNQGTYYNVKLYNSDTFIDDNWDGATSKVVVGASGSITSFQIQSQGSGYDINSNQLYFDNTNIGGSQDSFITITTAGISTAVGDVLQVTGLSTVTDSFYRISEVIDEIKVAVAKTSGDPDISSEQFVVNVGPSIEVTSSSFNNKVTTFNCNNSHDLYAGNKFKVIDTNNNNLGDFIVKTRTSATSFTAETITQLSATPKYLLRHYFSSNSGVSDRSDENLSARGQTMYAGDVLRIDNAGNPIGVSTQRISVEHPSAGIALSERFPIGSYVQAGDEIMRVSADNLSNPNKLNVIRGVFSTESVNHRDDTIIRKIRPIPIEFRRPSIIRASGHTFEYLGYGPGNYSTGLPQIQTRSLTEKEEFLVQSQERSSGIVVYTGMNNKGDFYIGNTKKSSATGQETSFDTPIPTVTGEDPARLSVIFDEVTVKERIVVEGGDSGEILSQFDGPVTFNNNIRMKKSLSVTGRVRLFSEQNSSSPKSGALILEGGMGVGKNVFIGENLDVEENLTVDGQSTFNNLMTVNDSIRINSANEQFRIRNGSTTINQFLVDTDNGNTTINGTLNVEENTTLNNVNIDENLYITGITTFNGILDANERADIDEVRIDGNTITTVDSNDLILDADSNKVKINANLEVSDNTTLGNQSTDTTTVTGILDVNGRADIDDVRINGTTISNVNSSTNSNLNLNPKGTGKVKVSTTLSVGNQTTRFLSDVSGDYGSIQINGGGENNYEGYSIDGRAVFMHNGSTTTGIYDDVNNKWLFRASHEGSASLYYNGDAKITTTNSGVDLNGTLDVSGNTTLGDAVSDTTTVIGTLDVTGIVTVTGSAVIDNVKIDGNTITTLNTNGNLTLNPDGIGSIIASGTLIANQLKVNDNEYIYAGSGNDLGIRHNETNSLIENKTGYLMIRNTRTASDNDPTIYIRAKADEESIVCRYGKSVDLYFNDSNKFQTTDGGANISGALTVTGDITAFASDERLKTNISPITDALFKVNSLNGFTYNFNEIGEKLGFNPDITYAGVSAQEVQKVLPEVVHPAPVDDKYITVQYDKVVPLLIEAIKELSDKVEKLEQRLEDK